MLIRSWFPMTLSPPFILILLFGMLYLQLLHLRKPRAGSKTVDICKNTFIWKLLRRPNVHYLKTSSSSLCTLYGVLCLYIRYANFFFAPTYTICRKFSLGVILPSAYLSRLHRSCAAKVGVVHFRPMTSSTHTSFSAKTQEKCDGNSTKTISSSVFSCGR